MTLVKRTKKPNPKLERFKLLCAQGITATEAGKLVGYSDSTATTYRTKHSDEIADLALTRFKALVPEAMRTIETVNAGSRSDATRLQAANRILEGAGAGVVHKSEITHKTDAEIDQALLDACNGDPAKVNTVLDALRPQTLH